MSDETNVDLDLFGRKVKPPIDRRGRPSYAKSKENQLIVATLIARNWTQDRIAGYIGCDPKTLRKNFSRELSDGADLVEGMALEALLHKMVNGDRIATQKILDVVDAGRLVTPVQQKHSKVAVLGKKDELTEAAKTPTGSWSDDFGSAIN